MNKLCELNPDFRKFLQDVKTDFDSKRIHREFYDKVPDNPEDLIAKLLK